MCTFLCIFINISLYILIYICVYFPANRIEQDRELNLTNQNKVQYQLPDGSQIEVYIFMYICTSKVIFVYVCMFVCMCIYVYIYILYYIYVYPSFIFSLVIKRITNDVY
jgi:hypothetical protein